MSGSMDFNMSVFRSKIVPGKPVERVRSTSKADLGSIEDCDVPECVARQVGS